MRRRATIASVSRGRMSTTRESGNSFEQLHVERMSKIIEAYKQGAVYYLGKTVIKTDVSRARGLCCAFLLGVHCVVCACWRAGDSVSGMLLVQVCSQESVCVCVFSVCSKTVGQI